MGRYISKRLIAMVVTVWFVITITFFLMHAIPGGPFTREKSLPPEIIEALNKKYNLDAPLHEQYIDYLKGVAVGDLGPSFKLKGQDVAYLIKISFPYSARLGAVTALFVILLGVPLGIISALKKNSIIDYIVTIIATVGVAVPGFVVGTFCLYIFTTKLNVLPPTGLSSPKNYIMPVLALGGFSLAFVTRLTRSSMLEVIQQDYIRTARAKGLSEFVVIGKHALKNALIPVVTFMGPMIAAVMTGSFVVENIFSIPGMGAYFVTSVRNRDYTLLMGAVIFFAIFYVIMILAIDIAYVFIDPRIKLNKPKN